MLGPALRTVLFVAVAGLLVAAGIGFHNEQRRGPAVAARPDPAAAREAGSDPAAALVRELVVRAGASGHFLVDAAVNGTGLTMLVDTGASGVVLSPDDARRVGLNQGLLDYSQIFHTANGAVRGAPVTLREVRVGQLSLTDVEATVNEAPMPISLLGMTFLARLEGYEVRDGRLVLRW